MSMYLTVDLKFVYVLNVRFFSSKMKYMCKTYEIFEAYFI